MPIQLAIIYDLFKMHFELFTFSLFLIYFFHAYIGGFSTSRHRPPSSVRLMVMCIVHNFGVSFSTPSQVAQTFANSFLLCPFGYTFWLFLPFFDFFGHGLAILPEMCYTVSEHTKARSRGLQKTRKEPQRT